MKIQNLKNIKLKNYQLIILCSLICLFFTILFGFILYTPLLSAGMKWQKALKKGNEFRDFYLKLPVPLDFRVYFFNITNPLEVQEGEKPIVKELGPYCYDAYKEKIIINENKGEDTLTYKPHDTYFFNQTRSGELSQDDYVTILNPLIVGIINTVAVQKPQYLTAVSKAFSVIFKESNSIYLTIKVRDILFDGMKIDCNVRDFSAIAMCSQFKGQPSMRESEKNIFYFSLFGSRNGTVDQEISVYRGIKLGQNLGRVVAINNRTDLHLWSEHECNVFLGTDGWIFPSFIKGDIYVVASDLCRNFKARHIQDIRFHGVKVKKYFADFEDFTSPNETCYCSKHDHCLPKGVMDLTKCLKVPLLCTLPHFLNTDESLIQQVEGLHPEIEKHIIKIYFEPTLGIPVLGQRRIQFNLEIKKIQKVPITASVPEAIHPILWLEEGIELEGYLLDKVITISNILNLMAVFRYFVVVFCLLLIGYGCYQAYKDWKLSKVAPIKSDQTDEKDTTTKMNEQEISNLDLSNPKNEKR